ncbi:glycosyltransferase [Lactiplantibacillus pentosus]|nr:glycosyltransferase [Lactiplantibacillus pentosus]MCT3297246.1 glycosyltransferase [Lactiplantibacillus pentosus]
MKKFLSVVIPMYNSEKTIVRCLNSIISIIVQSNLEKR